MALEEDVATLRKRITTAQQDRARAEHEREVAAAQVQEATTALRQEFGVDTIEAAMALVAGLEVRIRDECTRVTELLDRAQQPQ